MLNSRNWKTKAIEVHEGRTFPTNLEIEFPPSLLLQISLTIVGKPPPDSLGPILGFIPLTHRDIGGISP